MRFVPLICFALCAAAEDRLLVSGKPAAAAQGVWQLRGYGLILDIQPAAIRGFHHAAGYCWREPAERELATQFGVFEKPAPDTIVFATHPGDTRYHARRLDRLPDTCAKPASNNPQEQFDMFWSTFQEHYAFFKERQVDWNGRKLSGPIPAGDLFNALQKSLEGLNDPHVTLYDGKDRVFGAGRAGSSTLRLLRQAFEGQNRYKDTAGFRRAWEEENQRRVWEKLRDRKRALDGRLVWGITERKVGYLSIANMSDADEPSLLKELDQAIAAMQSAPALIVDVSLNPGGEDRIARLIASRFADKKRPAYTKAAYGSDVPPQQFFVEPGGSAQFTKPVYLLTSDITVSAAEIFTFCMRALPHVTHAGQATRGALSDMLPKPLPNGWRFTLSNEIYRDPAGELYEARGIPPARPIAVFTPATLFDGPAKAIEQIAAWIH